MSHVQLTRPQWHAMRRELYALNVWLASHPRRCQPDYDPRWDAQAARRRELVMAMPVPRDPCGFGVLAQNQSCRRSHVLHRVRQRTLAARAAALDTTGMDPLRAALARLEITFGGKA